MTNQERLVEANILDKDRTLSSEQEKVVKELTAEEIDVLISVKGKLLDAFLPDAPAIPITHHH